MTIRPLAQDTTRAADGADPTAYDSVWATTAVPEQQPEGLDRVMLAEDKLYVVLAVVLIIWFGLAFFVARTDRRIARLEARADRLERDGAERTGRRDI